MRRELSVYLVQLQDCLEELETFTAGKQLTDYQHDTMLRRAVEREFSIIGEIMRRILHHFPKAGLRIEKARSIADFRNVIMHEYDELDDRRIWDIVIRSAPILKQQIDEWIAEADIL